MAWCENNGVDFLFGLAKNSRLVGKIESELAAAQEHSQKTEKPARRFKDFTWQTRHSWSRERRVVAKAEWTRGEANPQFVVTSLAREEHEARHLYEKLYCARGEMENRIKECQLDLGACPRAGRRPDPGADRTSDHTMRANQLRLWFASMAYVLICALRRIGLKHTQFARALRHDPPQALEDRGTGAHQRAPHQAGHAVSLSLPGPVPRPHAALTAVTC